MERRGKERRQRERKGEGERGRGEKRERGRKRRGNRNGHSLWYREPCVQRRERVLVELWVFRCG